MKLYLHIPSYIFIYQFMPTSLMISIPFQDGLPLLSLVVMYLLLGLVGPSCRRKHSLGSAQITEQNPYSRVRLSLLFDRARLRVPSFKFYFIIRLHG